MHSGMMHPSINAWGSGVSGSLFGFDGQGATVAESRAPTGAPSPASTLTMVENFCPDGTASVSTFATESQTFTTEGVRDVETAEVPIGVRTSIDPFQAPELSMLPTTTIGEDVPFKGLADFANGSAAVDGLLADTSRVFSSLGTIIHPGQAAIHPGQAAWFPSDSPTGSLSEDVLSSSEEVCKVEINTDGLSSLCREDWMPPVSHGIPQKETEASMAAGSVQPGSS